MKIHVDRTMFCICQMIYFLLAMSQCLNCLFYHNSYWFIVKHLTWSCQVTIHVFSTPFALVCIAIFMWNFTFWMQHRYKQTTTFLISLVERRGRANIVALIYHYNYSRWQEEKINFSYKMWWRGLHLSVVTSLQDTEYKGHSELVGLWTQN